MKKVPADASSCSVVTSNVLLFWTSCSATGPNSIHLQIFYRQMRAGEPAEAAVKAEELLKERSLTSYYDEAALKGLKLAQSDVARGSLDTTRIETMRASVAETRR